MRSTGAPAFALIGAGALLGLLAARRDRRPAVRVFGGFDAIALPFAVLIFFVFGALPEAPRFAALEVAPGFRLTDHQGQMVSLQEVRAGGPVLLVFFRGFW